MKKIALGVLILVIAVVLIAGCTSTPSTKLIVVKETFSATETCDLGSATSYYILDTNNNVHRVATTCGLKGNMNNYGVWREARPGDTVALRA